MSRRDTIAGRVTRDRTLRFTTLVSAITGRFVSLRRRP